MYSNNAIRKRYRKNQNKKIEYQKSDRKEELYFGTEKFGILYFKVILPDAPISKVPACT